ncbi:hypothetical protein [Paenibacillus xylanexedens]|uniref:Uncharacterized protein n=1 Tax=Paenibacillus xylanexedens TaxID=528191 RepID=A0ABS4RLQ8_PAEXY|nr:hypothetical protein [Paenibacillus xylanexedens]MBP2243832.1 hypothetical protein [Paenibacillus xylanexedens]
MSMQQLKETMQLLHKGGAVPLNVVEAANGLLAQMDEYGTLIEQQGKEMIRLQQLANKQGKELEEVRKDYIGRQRVMDYLKKLYMNKRHEYYEARNAQTTRDAEIQMRLISEIQTEFKEIPHFDYVKYMRSLGQEGEGNQ